MPAFLLCIFVAAVHAGDSPSGRGGSIQTVGAVWSDFCASLGRGDYASAYSFFSADSRQVFPFPDFLVEYGPLSRARELVLSEPIAFAVNLHGDWAEIVFTVEMPVLAQEQRISVGMVRRLGKWELVAGRNEARERTEAAARNTLRHLGGLRIADENALGAALRSPPLAGDPIFSQYRFHVADGVVAALPLRESLRPYHVAPGVPVREGRSPADAPVQSATAPVHAPASVPAQAGRIAEPDGPVMIQATGLMPELSEPPPSGSPDSGALPELSAPPPLAPAAGSGAAAPPAASRLPDRITYSVHGPEL
ncbi:MAG: hypothetical protein LBJ46_00105 [Planctomycetota bacterium]|nr:hypothetical protein [Planctomycetota bacterium]